MHLPIQITDLAVILGVAAIVTLIFQKIRQPVVLGYLIAGVIVGPHTPTGLDVTDLPSVKVWGELGVIFLMFALGLEFTFHKLTRVGFAAGGTAIVEVGLMLVIGYGVGRLLGWNGIDSLFLGGILSISSTTIIIKAFDELGVKSRRFAEIVFGVLIVEDLVAILLLVALSTVAVTKSFFSLELLVSALKLILIVGSWFIIGYFLIPSFLRYVGKLLHDETLTVLSCALCLGLVVVATQFHYSAALGAFIMGSILAETGEVRRIESLIHPLRDLFAAVFFVSVGMLVDPRTIATNLWPIVLITLVTIGGKAFSSSLGALLTGQPLKRSVQVGFSLAQIGEFSFIIATLGTSLQVTSDFLYPIAVAVSVVTTFTTPYLIRFSETLAERAESLLPAGVTGRLAGYVAWAQRPKGNSALRDESRKRAMRLLLNAILVTVVFLSVYEIAQPKLREWLSGQGDRLQRFSGWSLSFCLASPFIWGMFFSFRAKGVFQFLARLFTVVWVGTLSSLFFSTGTTLALILVGSGTVFFALYRSLGRAYQWFERRFVGNFKKDEERQDRAADLLAPWDVHAVRMTVHQNSLLAGRAIKDEQIRERFGLNIIAIQRGLKVIASPTASEILFPKDELLVLGTDEQIEAFRALTEKPSGDAGDGRELSQYFLRRVRVDDSSALVGQSIRDSGLRIILKGLVVGLERKTLRTVNPDPATVLEPGDLLWVVSAPE